MDSRPVDYKTEGRPDLLPSLQAGGSGIEVEQVMVRVMHDLEDMGMAAHEDIRTELPDQGERPRVIMAGRAPDMGHQDLFPFAVPDPVLRVIIDQNPVVAVPGNTDERLEPGDGRSQGQSPAEIPRMPDLVDRGKEFAEFGAEHPVGIRKKTDEHL